MAEIWARDMPVIALMRRRCDSDGGLGVKVGGRPGRIREVKARGPQPLDAQTEKRSAVCRHIQVMKRRVMSEDSTSGDGVLGEGVALE